MKRSASACEPATGPDGARRGSAATTDATGTRTIDNLAEPAETARGSVTVRNPHTTLTETASPSSGAAPLAVTCTYTETNDGTDPISGVTLTDNLCSRVTYVSGDANANGVLDPLETWTYTFSQTLTAAGDLHQRRDRERHRHHWQPRGASGDSTSHRHGDWRSRLHLLALASQLDADNNPGCPLH